MSVDIFPDRVVQLLEKCLSWQSRRQEIIAGNIANLDTPRYRRRELDFHQALTAHLRGNPKVSLAATHPGHYKGNQFPELGLVKESQEGPDLDLEMVEMAKNQVGYQASVEMLIKKLDQVRSVIDGVK